MPLPICWIRKISEIHRSWSLRVIVVQIFLKLTGGAGSLLQSRYSLTPKKVKHMQSGAKIAITSATTP